MSEQSGQQSIPSIATPPTLGRRERNKQEKQQRIFDAADALFAEHGYSAVTTQQIAEQADVASGTIFRYASSKAELLLMVHNQRYQRAFEQAEGTLLDGGPVEQRLAALLTPIVRFGRLNEENTAAYTHAMLFETSTEPYRLEALQLMGMLQDRIDAVLSDTWQSQHPQSQYEAPDAASAARAIYAALIFAAIPATHSPVSAEQQLADILNQVDVIARGYLHTAPAHNATSAEELTDKSQPTTSKEQRND